MTRFARPDLDRVFRDGERFGDGTGRVVEAGEVVLPTGRVVACDPGYLLGNHRNETAFTRSVPPGRYAVSLALLSRTFLPPEHPNHWTVAAAMVRFHDRPVERWEMALRPGWHPATLRPGYHHGYGVDGGRGCFVDDSAVRGLPDNQKAFYTAFEEANRLAMEAYRRATADPSEANQREAGRAFAVIMREAYRLVVPPALGEMLCHIPDEGWRPCAPRSALLDAATGANVVSFPSGEGDGCFASYFGLAADGSAARLVTDFGLLVRSVMRTLEVPVVEGADPTHPELADTGSEGCRIEWNKATGYVSMTFGGDTYIQEVRFENRPGQEVRSTAWGGDGTWYYRLSEPLEPTARLLISYTARVEAL